MNSIILIVFLVIFTILVVGIIRSMFKIASLLQEIENSISKPDIHGVETIEKKSNHRDTVTSPILTPVKVTKKGGFIIDAPTEAEEARSEYIQNKHEKGQTVTFSELTD